MGIRDSDPTQRAREMEGVDFGNTASDYATYRVGIPDSFFAQLEQHGVPIRGRSRRRPWYGYRYCSPGPRHPRSKQGDRD